MTEWVRSSEISSIFHVHVDGAILPAGFESYAKAEYGFFNDDFDHRLVIEAPGAHATLPGRQLTLKLRDRARVRGICEDLRERADSNGFAGMIQSEFVMAELFLRSQYAGYQPAPFPFSVKLRKIDTETGERFKSHELHLELSTDGTDARLISELARSGMSVNFGSGEVTFTVSGSLDPIRKIQQCLLDYLKQVQGFESAKLVTEATVFHSLHRMRPENTPAVVQSISLAGSAPVFLPAVPALAAASIA